MTGAALLPFLKLSYCDARCASLPEFNLSSLLDEVELQLVLYDRNNGSTLSWDYKVTKNTSQYIIVKTTTQPNQTIPSTNQHIALRLKVEFLVVGWWGGGGANQ